MRRTYSSFNRIKMKLYFIGMIEDNEFDAIIGLIEMNEMLEEDDSQASRRVAGVDEAKRSDGEQVGRELGVETTRRDEIRDSTEYCRGSAEESTNPATGTGERRVGSADE